MHLPTWIGPILTLMMLILCTTMDRSAGQTPQEWITLQVPEAIKVIDAYHSTESAPSRRTLHIVYWTPADRDPAPEFRQRLSRVLFDIQDFYRREMRRLGFGDRTIRLGTDEDGLLTIHMVQGKKPYANYRVESGDAIRKECLPTLLAAGIDADKETIILFCNMSNWDSEKGTMFQNSPYYATGGLRSGTAWQVDSPLLDAGLLQRKEPMIQDGQYGRISVGKYNSIFVGGVCHELGHALGLPHNMERPDERAAFGTALMGSGNRTYGEDLRNEGRGSFLTLAEGMRLASHPLFTRSEKGIDLNANARLTEVSVDLTNDSKGFRFAAKVTADPPAYAVIGYMDPNGGSDYDATTTTAVPGHEGRFELNCSALKAGHRGVLRIVVCQANGGRINDQVLSVPYTVSEDGLVDLSQFQNRLLLEPLMTAIQSGDANASKVEMRKLESNAGKSSAVLQRIEIARSLLGTIDFKPGPSPAVASGESCWLSDSLWKKARVGWGRPLVNRLPETPIALSVGGQIFPRGMYAHAPSTYSYDLDGKWSRLTGSTGLADGHEGTVVFVILGDGKELWRSKKMEEGKIAPFDVLVKGVSELTLKVEDGGDGNGSDWGLWLQPKVER